MASLSRSSRSLAKLSTDSPMTQAILEGCSTVGVHACAVRVCTNPSCRATLGSCSSCRGELENLKVKDLLTYLGFETSVDDVQEMVSRVDFNGSKTMDRNEFLRLMRLQREMTITSYTAAYNRNRLFARGGAPPEEIRRVLGMAKLYPNVHILGRALSLVEKTGEYDRTSTQSLQFEGFLKVADFCRKTIPVYNRRHAHFQLDQIEDLRKSFDSQDAEKKGYVTIGSFLLLLADTSLAVNTVAGRARMLLPYRDSANAGCMQCFSSSRYEQLERAREVLDVLSDGNRRNSKPQTPCQAALEAGVSKDEARVFGACLVATQCFR